LQSLKLVNGDITFENGELVIIEGGEELAQCCRVGLGTNSGEWFLNPELGIEFMLFLDKNPNEEEMRDELMRGLLQEERIQTIEDVQFSVDHKARTMTISFTAMSVNGEKIEERGIELAR